MVSASYTTPDKSTDENAQLRQTIMPFKILQPNMRNQIKLKVSLTPILFLFFLFLLPPPSPIKNHLPLRPIYDAMKFSLFYMILQIHKSFRR